MSVTILNGDALAMLATLPDASVQTCVTSPPYFGLRDYGHDGQIGLEPTPTEYVGRLVAVFREVRRVLKDDGTLWLNLGDSYAGGGYSNHDVNGAIWKESMNGDKRRSRQQDQRNALAPLGIKPKDLIGTPWRVAFALQADGWYLRQDIIWHKPNPMPESVTDRCTKAHEYVFLLAKSARYYYDAKAISDPAIHAGRVVEYDGTQKNSEAATDPRMRTRIAKDTTVGDTRNARSVWTITTKPFREAHFATMPPQLAERCVKAGSKPGDVVLDPFGGAGTTGLVADRLGRNVVLIELNPTYADMARTRIDGETPLFGNAA
jgi:DNA modification methylase